MKKTAFVFLFALCASLTLSTCGDDLSGPGIDPGVDSLSDSAGTVSYFPNVRNVVWKYEIYDSLTASVVDTITITIRGERSVSSGGLARVWETLHSATDSTDSSFVRIDSDSVQFFVSRTFSFGNDIFLMPLFQGKLWQNPGFLGADSGGVLAIDSISVPAGDFPVAARVLNGWQANFQSSNVLRTSWVVDSVGIILRQDFSKVVINSVTTVTSNTVWRLLSSNLVVAP